MPYLPAATQAGSSKPVLAVISGTPATTSNYSQYLAFSYTQVSGTGTNSSSGVITIPATALTQQIFTYSNSNGLSSYFPTESLNFIRTDGHMFPSYVASGNTIQASVNGTYKILDGTIAGYAGVGLTAFGGPVAHIGYFRREFVERRAWLSEGAFADLLALAQFLPGPASSQLGMAIGLRRAGYLGMAAAWLGFTLPSAAVYDHQRAR